MQIAVGAAAALVTWTVLIASLVLVGLVPAVASRTRWSLKTLRISMWWGLLIMTISVLVVNLFVPLRSASAGVCLLATAGVLAIVGLVAAFRKRLASPGLIIRGSSRGTRALLVVLVLGMAYMAVAALGPVTNYDTGLYHLGAIKYSGDYATIPGLANLMNPLGYNNSIFPLAAALGNGPWDGVGYRLVNGLFMAMLATDLVLRILERRASVGTYIMMFSVCASWIPLISLSDYWVTSPTSDSAVMILTLVATSYFADAIHRQSQFQADALVAVIVSVLIVSMRPTMAFFLGVVLVIVVARTVMTRTVSSNVRWLPWIWGVGLSISMFGVQVARDYRLSGWLEYPLSLYHFNVPWLAEDPLYVRMATLGAARNPQDLWTAANGWSWIPAWLGYAVRQWETYFFTGLVLVAVTLCVIARVRSHVSAKRVLVALTPSTVSVVAWWCLSPPTYRFIWGALFSVALIPMGWAAHSLAKDGWRIRNLRPLHFMSYAGSSVLIVLIAFCSITRLDIPSIREQRQFRVGPIDLPYSVTPIPRPPAITTVMATGLVVLVPTESDQCWDVYPLCASGMGTSVGLISEDIQGGFNHQ
jgi:hypothetical protein